MRKQLGERDGAAGGNLHEDRAAKGERVHGQTAGGVAGGPVEGRGRRGALRVAEDGRMDPDAGALGEPAAMLTASPIASDMTAIAAPSSALSRRRRPMSSKS